MSIESGPSHSSDKTSKKEVGIDPDLAAYLAENDAFAYSQETDVNDTRDETVANIPEETDTRTTLNSSSELNQLIHAEGNDQLHLRDKLMNKKDMLTKKSLMYDQRDSARQWKVARLESKLEVARAKNPNSNKTRQLERKLNWQKMMLGNIRKKSGAIDARIENRGEQRIGVDHAKEAAREFRKKLREIAEQTEEERKRRWRVRKEALTSKSEGQRSRLKAEMKSWDKNTLAKFYQDKTESALKSFRMSEDVGDAIDRIDHSTANSNSELNYKAHENIEEAVDQLEAALDDPNNTIGKARSGVQ